VNFVSSPPSSARRKRSASGTPAFRPGTGTRERIRSFLTCSGEANGFRERYSATRPATCGAAIEVPFHFSYPPPGTVESTSYPGAYTSTEEP